MHYIDSRTGGDESLSGESDYQKRAKQWKESDFNKLQSDIALPSSDCTKGEMLRLDFPHEKRLFAAENLGHMVSPIPPS